MGKDNRVRLEGSFEDRWQEIEDEFDWIKVQETMEHLNWVWVGRGVPSVRELKDQAFSLMREAASLSDGKYSKVSSGGLAATYTPEYMELEFILTKSTSFR